MLPGWPNRNNKLGEEEEGEEVRGQEQKGEEGSRERLKRTFWNQVDELRRGRRRSTVVFVLTVSLVL